MSATDVPANPNEAAETWPELSLYERRVLGVMIEKQKTTPDAYPLSMNGLITGCNQKSNRDPVLNLVDLDLEDALNSLKQKGLVLRVTGSSRVERWRHNLYEAWNLDKFEMAVLADLLLRGAQTEGELRTHASRMDEIADLETLRAILGKLAERKLVVYLTPQGQRGTKLTHGFHSPEELKALRSSAGTLTAAPAAPAAPSVPVAAVKEDRMSRLEQDLARASAEVSELRTLVSELTATVAGLREEVKTLKDALGG